MCGYFCTESLDFMLKDKSLLEYTNLFSPNEYKNNDKIILNYFRYNLNKLKWWKCIAMFAINIRPQNLGVIIGPLPYPDFIIFLYVLLLFPAKLL